VPVQRILTIGLSCLLLATVARPQAAASGLTAALVCTRQAVSPSEAFPVKITIANESRSPSASFERADVVSPKSLVAAAYDKKGQWVGVRAVPEPGRIELRPGETFTMSVLVTMPEALTKTPNALLVQWVGRGALEGIRSNEVSVSIREDRNPTVALDTSEGIIVLELWPEKAPNHVANLITLAKAGFYDGRLFHRVIPNFMIQTGCPQGTGAGDPGYKIAAEINDAPFAKGVLGMARSSEMDSAGSQFFICVADSNEVKSLDKKYTAFGRVIEGQDVADKIALVPRDTQKGDRPYKDVTLRKATVTMPASYQLPEVKKVGAAPATKPASRPEAK
jgi:peptidyl-prolyl cis-trans isomerase B (cyclophilin B)